MQSTFRSRHAILLAATSASVLAHEILLMRIFSFTLWHHLASMVISMALLGFGAAGSFLFLLRRWIRPAPDEFLAGLAGAAALSFPLSLALAGEVGLDPLGLAWELRQWFYMAFTYLAMALPFFFTGGIVGVILSGAGEWTPRIYAADLVGAGCGALAVIPALYLAPPWLLLAPLGGIVLLAAVPVGLSAWRPGVALGWLILAAALLSGVGLFRPPSPQVHDAKRLSIALNYPDACLEAKKTGPMGLVHVVESSFIHHVPGLSLAYGLKSGADLPEQKGIYVNAQGPSPVARFTGDLQELSYLDFTTPALAYHVRSPERVLIVGVGGGAGVLLGIYHEVPHIVALEANSQVVDLLKGPLSEFSSRMFERPGIRVVVDEARQFVREEPGRFGLIELSLLETFGASGGGAQAAAEEYLFTVEAFSAYLDQLNDKGILSITRWLKAPPRDSLRVVATAVEALRRRGVEDPEEHILFIRSWKTGTILVSPRSFTPEEVARVRGFCIDRSFDTAFLPGMRPEEANRFDIQPEPWYYEGTKKLLGPGKEDFLNSYVFDVSPTWDNRPYFSKFFRWERALELFRHLRREWVTRMESGYLFLLATLVQATFAGGTLILLPLLFLRRGKTDSAETPPSWKRVSAGVPLLFFTCLGFGFMFLEMALLPKLVLILAHPVYAAGVVLSTLLVFAGLGSLAVQRAGYREGRLLWLGTAGLGLWLLFQATVGQYCHQEVLGWGMVSRLVFCVVELSAPGFLLGWFFPLGLRTLGRARPALVPWAWGVNGCSSVIGTVLAACLAMSLGFLWVMGIGCGLYVVSALLFGKMRGPPISP